MANALTKTEFNFAGQKSVYHGKVRDVPSVLMPSRCTMQRRLLSLTRFIRCL